MDEKEVQYYHRTHYSVNYFRDFFDLEDILVHAGITAGEKAALENALDACILYKDATPSFMLNWGGFNIHAYCGLSMHLPNSRTAGLNEFYKTLDWNIATGLVK